jgi:hypothetical protein
MMMKRIKGDWEVSFDEQSGYIEHRPSGYTASIGAMEQTGSVSNEDWEEMPVPENIQLWALALEPK